MTKRVEPFVCNNIDCDKEGLPFPDDFDYCPHCGEMLEAPKEEEEEEEKDDPS